MLNDSYTKTQEKIWLSSPHMGGNELNYIKEAFAQNWIAPLGHNVTGFEEDLELFLDQNVNVAALSSGTAALHLALINCGVSAGDEVICQSFTFSASANPIVYQGAMPVFVDSERDTWNMCPQALEMAIVDRIKKGKRIKAIIVVHIYGMPAKMDEILMVAKRFNIPVVEDAAEAIGSMYNGKNCGTLGTYGILSFNGNKIITTSGGGALVCKDEWAKKRTIFLATQARDKAPHYEHTEIGFNYRMSNITAGIGRGQMEVLDRRIASRRAMNGFYRELFRDIEGVELLAEPSDRYFSNFWLSAITINETVCGINREAIMSYFSKANIEVRPLWKPMHTQPVFKGTPYYGGTVAEDLFKEGLCLPSGSNLTRQQHSRIKEAVKEVFNNKNSRE